MRVVVSTRPRGPTVPILAIVEARTMYGSMKGTRCIANRPPGVFTCSARHPDSVCGVTVIDVGGHVSRNFAEHPEGPWQAGQIAVASGCHQRLLGVEVPALDSSSLRGNEDWGANILGIS